MSKTVDMMETSVSAEYFAFGVGRIDNLGAVSRIIFYAPSMMGFERINEKSVAIVVPNDQLSVIIQAIADSIGSVPLTKQRGLGEEVVTLQ